MAIGAADVEAVSAQVRALATSDVSGLSRSQLLEATHAVAALERVVGAWGSRLAGEVSRRSAPELPGGGLARTEGFGSAQRMISKVRGGSFTDAQRSIAAGDAFTPTPVVSGGRAPDAGAGSSIDGGATVRVASRVKYPAVAEASMAGELSVDAAGLIVGGLNQVAGRVEAQYLVDLEASLVAGAAGKSSHEVQRMVARIVARVDRVEHEARERKNYDERYLFWKTDHQGVVTLHGRLDAVTAAPIVSVLEQMTTREMRNQSRPGQGDGMGAGFGAGFGDAGAASSGGTVGAGAAGVSDAADTRTAGQMRADALHELARHALGCKDTERSGVRTSIVVRMNLSDLERGAGLGSIDGVDQPVSVSQLRRLAGDAGFIPEVLGGDGEVLDLGRQVRGFTQAQRRALLERDGGCAKCHAPPEHCEAHHIRWWEHGGRSDLSNGVMLCTRCHHDIHRYGWEIEAGPRTVRFIPPPQIDPEGKPITGGAHALDLDGFMPPPPWGSADPCDQVRDEQIVREWEHEFRAWEAQFDSSAFVPAN